MTYSGNSNMKQYILVILVTFLFYYYDLVKGSKLPDPKFITDVVNYMSRIGVIYHLPPMKQSEIFTYRKSLNLYR